MAPVECSVPDCDYVTPDGTKELVLNHLTLHTQAVHLVNMQPAGAPGLAAQACIQSQHDGGGLAAQRD